MAVSEQLKDKIAHFSNLPTLPQVITRLMKCVNDPLASANDVAAIVGQDLSLSAKLLRLANSAYYGIPRSITNIGNAVVILGLKVINTMALSITVFDMFPDDGVRSPLFDRKAFWIHSLGCGIIAKLLTARIKRVILFDQEEAFCAGLLHDIGKVVMEQYLHTDFHASLEYAAANNVATHEAEKTQLGYMHTDIAEYLTETWNLPSELRLPVVYHHDPQSSVQCNDIVTLCHISDVVCHESGLGSTAKYQRPSLIHGSLEKLGFAPEDIEAVKVLIPAELEKTLVFFDIADN